MRWKSKAVAPCPQCEWVPGICQCSLLFKLPVWCQLCAEIHGWGEFISALVVRRLKEENNFLGGYWIHSWWTEEVKSHTTQATAHQGNSQALKEAVDNPNMMQIMESSYMPILVTNNSYLSSYRDALEIMTLKYLRNSFRWSGRSGIHPSELETHVQRS